MTRAGACGGLLLAVSPVVFGAAGCASILGYEDGYKLAATTADAGDDAGDEASREGGGPFGEVIELARDQSPSSLDVDAENVYVTNGLLGTVMRIPKAGGPPKTIASGQFSPAWLHLTSTQLIWARTAPLNSCEPATYPPGSTTVFSLSKTAPDGTAPGGVVGSAYCAHTGVMAYDGAAVYEFRYRNGTTGNDVVRSTGGTSSSISPGQAGVVALASTGGSVYWAQNNAGTVTKFDLPAGPPVPFLLSLAGPRALAVDDKSLYFVTDGGDVGKLDHDKPAQAPTILASGQKLPQRVALDAESVYFTNKGDGTVRAVPKAGGEVVTLAEGQLDPGPLAVDATGVYWGTLGDGAVRMVRR